jgi:hypothetical protein
MQNSNEEANKRDYDSARNWFTYHKPHGNQADRYERLRAAGLLMANNVILLCPPGADRTAALRKLRECVMTANAAIACGEPNESTDG